MRYFCGWYDIVCAVKRSGFTHLICAAEEGNGHRRPGKKPAKAPGVPAKCDEAESMAWKDVKGETICKNKNEEGEEYKRGT